MLNNQQHQQITLMLLPLKNVFLCYLHIDIQVQSRSCRCNCKASSSLHCLRQLFNNWMACGYSSRTFFVLVGVRI
jgi:hypothetical protein